MTRMGTCAYVRSVGLLAPGLPSWAAGAPVLAGTTPYESAPLPPVQGNLLPPNERRRAPLAVRMALQVCEDVMKGELQAAAALASVFATSDADTDIVHRICGALAETQRVVSPTDFHNSVHNAAAGYWGVAAAARQASTTIAAHDFCLAAGLRESLAKLVVDDIDVLLAVFDVPPPPPLFAVRPIAQPAAVALWLTREPGEHNLGRLSLTAAKKEDTMSDPALESLRQSNPALRALPLLQALSRHESALIGVRADPERLLGVEFET